MKPANPALIGIFAILILIMAILSGCIQSNPQKNENDSNSSQKVLLSISPIQCGENSWQKWHSSLNRTYIRAPTEKEILTEYFRTVQNIEILDFKNIPAKPGTIVCAACNCSRGDTIEVLVSEKDKAKMIELGWKEKIEIAKPLGVSVKTDKLYYNSGEIVKITLSNDSERGKL